MKGSSRGAARPVLHVEGHSSNLNSSAELRTWRADPEESPAGGLTGTGVHVLDAFVDLVGPARRVLPSSTVQAGAGAARQALRAAALRERRLRHVGGGTGDAALLAGPCLRRSRQRETVRDTEIVRGRTGGSPSASASPPVDTLRAELEAFAVAAAGRAAYPRPPEDVVATVACFEAIVRSVAAGGAPIAV